LVFQGDICLNSHSLLTEVHKLLAHVLC
jgi:hypothetical protein